MLTIIQVTGLKPQFTVCGNKSSLRDMIDNGTRDTDDSVVSLVVQMFFCSTRFNNASETHLPLVHWSLIADYDVRYTKDGTGRSCTYHRVAVYDTLDLMFPGAPARFEF